MISINKAFASRLNINTPLWWAIMKVQAYYFNTGVAVTRNSGRRVLGIESSCDDTGAAVVDEDGQILGEALNSQTAIHIELGGILPPVARDLHMKNIEKVVSDAMDSAAMSFKEVDAIAVTIKPGMSMSLLVGLNYAKHLVSEYNKPFIPIHHMEAHALTVRLTDKVEFPYLTLLISGGHSLLAVVRDVDDFLLIGKGLDDAPGDAFDKTARRLKLKGVPECKGLCGGRSIEIMARGGNPLMFDLRAVMSQHVDCNFSFAGLKAWIDREITKEEIKHGVTGYDVIPTVSDICASFQYSVAHHLAKRLQRGLLFCEMNNLLPTAKKTLVISGGVASNLFIRQSLERMCLHYNCSVVCPPLRLCSDNGVMIAWNGMERLRVGRGIVLNNSETIDIQTRCPLGVDLTDEVRRANIKLPRIKILASVEAT